ncbi:hypothetical protein EDB83DRAFT_2318160 [Lactarius deliciosus]|nr:hypothetical protein EDB83DRAFT_2318160 [Lactarius deliciosus]
MPPCHPPAHTSPASTTPSSSPPIDLRQPTPSAIGGGEQPSSRYHFLQRHTTAHQMPLPPVPMRASPSLPSPVDTVGVSAPSIASAAGDMPNVAAVPTELRGATSSEMASASSKERVPDTSLTDFEAAPIHGASEASLPCVSIIPNGLQDPAAMAPSHVLTERQEAAVPKPSLILSASWDGVAPKPSLILGALQEATVPEPSHLLSASWEAVSPESSHVPDASRDAVAPKLSHVPNVSQVAAAPKPSHIPDASQVTAAPEPSHLPDTSHLPDASWVAVAPEPSHLPDASQVTAAPEPSHLPNASQVPAAPEPSHVPSHAWHYIQTYIWVVTSLPPTGGCSRSTHPTTWGTS